MNIQVDPTSSNLASAMLNSKIRPRAVVGYGVKIFHPSPPNYVTRSPGCKTANFATLQNLITFPILCGIGADLFFFTKSNSQTASEDFLHMFLKFESSVQ